MHSNEKSDYPPLKANKQWLAYWALYKINELSLANLFCEAHLS